MCVWSSNRQIYILIKNIQNNILIKGHAFDSLGSKNMQFPSSLSQQFHIYKTLVYA